MNARVKAIIVKEWDEMRRNGLILLTALIPALILVAVPAVKLLELKAQLGPLDPIPAKTLHEAFGLILAFFFMLPVVVPATIASYSIIGEKQNRTLEPVLATRVTTSELLMGKALGCAIPSILLTWVTFGLSVAGVWVVEGSRFVSILWQPGIVAALGLLAPMVTILGMLLILLISTKSSDPREAGQWALSIVVPLAAAGIAIGAGKLSVGVPTIALTAAVVAVINVVMLRLVTALFQRERILTQWK